MKIEINPTFMTARKRQWLNKIYHDSQELNHTSDINISWTSSESEDEEIIPKKIKIMQVLNMKSKIQKSELDTEQETNDPVKLKLIIQEINKSPVLNQSRVEESPLLTGTTSTNESPKNSPIIAKTNIFKEVRYKYKQCNSAKKSINSPSSPDIFETEFTQLIDNQPSILNLEGHEEIISPSTPLCEQYSLLEPSNYIDNFPSQTSSQVVNYATSNSDVFKTDTTDTSDDLYHFPVRRKKRYKKGGLAFVLQKTLRLQKTRLSIWEHEIYKNKTDIFNNCFNEEVIIFQVNNVNMEYGNILLECNGRKENCNSELILIAVGSVVNVNFIVGNEYKLFSPYKMKNISYKSKQVCCYFNISKFLSY